MAKHTVGMTESIPCGIGTEAQIEHNYVTGSLPLTLIRPSDYNPRKQFDEEGLNTLAESLKTHGMIEPLIIRRHPDRTGFEIVCGERRFRAAHRAGLKMVPVVIQDLTDTEARELALVENLERADLNPIEQAAGFLALSEMGMSQSEIGKRIGRSQESVAGLLRLLKLPPDVQERIADGTLTVSHGKALARYSDFPEVVCQIAELAVKNNTPSKQLETSALPYGYNLKEAGLAVSLDYITERVFDWQTTCKRNCPYGAFRPHIVANLGYCLKPEHYHEVYDAALLEKNVEQLKRIETLSAESSVPVVSLDSAAYAPAYAPEAPGQERYTYIHKAPEGCDTSCPCYKKAISTRSEAIQEICTNPDRYRELEEAQQKRDRQRHIDLANAMHEQALEVAKDKMVVWGALIAATVLKDISDDDVLAKAFKQLGVSLPVDIFHYSGTTPLHVAFEALSQQSVRKSLAFVLFRALLEEEAEQRKRGTWVKTPMHDWILGVSEARETEEGEETIDCTAPKESSAGDSSVIHCARCREEIPEALFETTNDPHLNVFRGDKNGAAIAHTFLETCVLIVGEEEAVCNWDADDEDAVHESLLYYCSVCSPEVAFCQHCGCTEEKPCPQGCGWTDSSHTACTVCEVDAWSEMTEALVSSGTIPAKLVTPSFHTPVDEGICSL